MASERPNGIWGRVVSADDEALRYLNSDSPEGEESDEFPSAGVAESGATLYDLTGWVWISDPGDEQRAGSTSIGPTATQTG